MSGWWRRNRLGLVAVLVLAPVTVGVVFQKEWGGFTGGGATQAVDASLGDVTEFGRATWRVTGSERIRWSSAPGTEAELPSGTDLVVVSFEVSPTALDEEAQATGCLLRLHERRAGAPERDWALVSPGSVDQDVPEGDSSACDSTITAPYTVRAGFLVPVDAGSSGELRVGIEVADEMPRYLRVTL